MLPLQRVAAFSSTMEYYHYDHQGSLLEVYDGNTNKRLLSQAWSPWGERQVLHTTVSGDKNNLSNLLSHGLPVHLSYTGHKELLATGLVFAGDTRLYDPRLKRFLNSDDRTTGGVRGQNRYTYAYNNPMNYIDRDGHIPITFAGRIAVVLAGYMLRAKINQGIVNAAIGRAAINELPRSGIRRPLAETLETSVNTQLARRILKQARPDLNNSQRNYIINAFVPNTLTIKTVRQQFSEYRYYDGLTNGANLYGRWSTPMKINTATERISWLALPNNQANKKARVTHQQGAVLLQGQVAPQLHISSTLTGGGTQTFHVSGPAPTIQEIKFRPNIKIFSKHSSSHKVKKITQPF